MTDTTTNLGLVTYNNSTDQSGSFLNWTQAMSGSSNSNMTKIDDFAGWTSASITNLTNDISGSITNISGSETSISGSLTTITANLENLGLRLYKIDEFTGAGQADFDNIPQTYSHLLIMGVAKGDVAIGSVGVVADFNGDANSSNYSITNWNSTGDGVPVTSTFTLATTHGGVYLGYVPGNDYANYGGTFLALIPNYSGSSGFYKSCIGLSAYYGTGAQNVVGQLGGVWKSTAAITRIRLSANWNLAQRLNFASGTKISVYGFG